MSCHHPIIVFVTATFVMTCGLAAAWGEEVIRLGGVRNVTATVSESDGAYRISVEMLPVRAFDPATNEALNLSKGQMYVAQSLGKYLKARNLTIRGLNVRESGTAGNAFRLIAVVPRDGVSTVRADTIASQGQKTADTASPPSPPADPTRPQTGTTSRRHEIRLTADATPADFLNRKADYLDTIVRLQEAISEEGESLERQSLKSEDFYNSIESVEERAEAAFKALARQIEEDKLLSELLEREELRPAVNKSHTKVIKSLKAVVARFDAGQEKTMEGGE